MSVLSAVHEVVNKRYATLTWVTANENRGAQVEMLRRYADGEHDANLTKEMRSNLRIAPTPWGNGEFNVNQCDNVIQALVDRLTVTGIEGDNDAATQWAAGVMDWNRFDGFQVDVTESAIRDGDSYVMVEWDNDEQMPSFTHQLAFDGREGVVVIHNSRDKSLIDCAIKVWVETDAEGDEINRVNVYYPDKVEKFSGPMGGSLTLITDGPNEDNTWTMPDGTAIGVPVVQFRNRTKGNTGYGASELTNAIPLQNALNRTLHSMVMTAENTGFPIRWIVGGQFPAALAPGVVIEVNPVSASGAANSAPNAQQIEMLKAVRIGAIDQSELVPFIDMARWLKAEINTVTGTPTPDDAGSAASGESLKQREVRLIGKAKRFQVKAGNSWEDVMALAHRVTKAYATTKPPECKRWQTRWQDPQIRNDKEVIENAIKVKDLVGEKEALRLIGKSYDYNEAKIDKLLEEKAAGDVARFQVAGQAMLPGFSDFGGAASVQGTAIPALEISA